MVQTAGLFGRFKPLKRFKTYVLIEPSIDFFIPVGYSVFGMGYLTEELSDEISRLSQQRGRQYFLSGAVKRIDGDGLSINAVVQGTIRYDVTISSVDGFLDYSCTCPYFERDFEPCKHIWAACLAAEQKGYLKRAGDYVSPDFAEAIPEVFPEKNYPRLALVKKPPPRPDWKKQLQPLLAKMEADENRLRSTTPPEREFVYFIDVSGTLAQERLVVQVVQRERRMNGAWGKLKTKKLGIYEINDLADPRDRRILATLFGSRREIAYSYSPYYSESIYPEFVVPRPLWDVVLPLMCATGRCLLRVSITDSDHPVVHWDDGDPWELCLKVARENNAANYVVKGALRRGEAEMELAKPVLLLAGGLVFWDGWIGRLNDHGAFSWISLLRAQGSLSIPKDEVDTFIAELLRFSRQPILELPEELKFEVVAPRPKPNLIIKPGERHPWARPHLLGKLSFDYEGVVVPYDQRGSGVYQRDRRRLIRRDLEAEITAEKRLIQLGFRSGYSARDSDIGLSPDQLPKVVRALTSENWHVEAEGKLYRAAGALSMEISSGVDWFELEGGAQFGDARVTLPRLLRAIKQGEQTVRLDDGTLGILPEEWMKKYGLLADLGNVEGNHLRFTRSQVGLLDALLDSEPAMTADAVFERVRKELHDFTGVGAADPPTDFFGELRGYQLEGLGWLYFIQRFGFGGCLADDMGLGKTVQVLALLESRRASRAGNQTSAPRPSLVIVPRSLVFHWKKEALQFAPKLKILDHTGGARLKPGDHFDDYDVVITTYGTLRRDALQFKNLRFDYCILDEAQAIKNAGTLSAKAARLLNADHRLALSGTPVENHLGELWSLFEFLNPGMLGSASVFGRAGRNPDANTRPVLARALRPFILRRTKSEVARELPPKTEQTIYCDLDPRDRKLYNELRDYYRSRLLKNVGREDMAQLKFQALEALLRLRQAACHPGLIDKKKTAEPSAKIDTLLAQLDQVLEEGHKILVFSQFTSLLAIVRSRLDGAKIPYGYLDGRTRDRESRVEQFQNDPNLKLFLISLKAGGLGLNLHAAEYVYLLDPWWNPAVEAQAIDRAHRIGQTRQVFAYRLIARDTVEEKVLELQQTKRDLADAIITADNSLMHNLSREDLELLLS
jgi:superfamily II DNA or RNA helicase